MWTLSLRILVFAVWGATTALLPAAFAQAQARADTAVARAAPPDSARGGDLLLGVQRFGLAEGKAAFGFEARYPVPRNLNLFFHREEPPRTRLTLALEGVGLGANTAGFLGAMGNAIGLWDEHTAWALIAAGASVGAIWKGLSTDTP